MIPDQSAAHQFLSEFRTGFGTQPLPYQHGVEARTLESLWEMFGHARDAMKKFPGCELFAREVTEMLNMHLRPFTGKWQKAKEEGVLNSRDGGDAFRGELDLLRLQLRNFASRMHEMAYGAPANDDESPLPMTVPEMALCFADLPFGIRHQELIDPAQVDAINQSEGNEVSQRRANYPFPAPEGLNAVGLAFSGGGIRSATFCLGVTQVLADWGLLKHVDFLSTVSGGGYTGSFLTVQLGTGTTENDVAGPFGPDPGPIREVRQRAKFLAVYSLWKSWGMVTATLAGLLMNWTVPLLALVVLAALTTTVDLPGYVWPAATGISGLLAVGSGLAYYGLLRARASLAHAAGWVFSLATLACAVFGLCWALVVCYQFFFPAAAPTPEAMWHDLWHRTGGWGVSLAGIGGVAALVPMVLRFVPLLKTPAIRKIVIKLALFVAGLIIPVLGVAIFFLLCALGHVETVSAAGREMPGTCFLWTAAALLALVAVFLLNINLTGPHRLYRNGLDKTFVQKREDEDARVDLHTINPDKTAPCHLVNAAVNLLTSMKAGLRERRCDFFLFSKHWTGSPVTGYVRTSDWKMNGHAADLGSAMAISGAAFSANMGLGSMPTLRALLAFLNVRLGFWIRRPDAPGLWGLSKWGHPGFLCLLREMFGVFMAEHHRWLNLSDGGHIENLAVYELLRRRCKFIICVDGEADPDYSFQGLMTLVRHAQIDFGVHIEPRLEDIRPLPETGFSRSHYHLCRVHYPDGIGLLLYLKLSVTGNESELIHRYRSSHPEFPHQSTLDQFFDQEQFEAYRQLGVHVAEGLFSNALMSHQPAPETIPIWFRRLAANLLEPET